MRPLGQAPPPQHAASPTNSLMTDPQTTAREQRCLRRGQTPAVAGTPGFPLTGQSPRPDAACLPTPGLGVKPALNPPKGPGKAPELRTGAALHGGLAAKDFPEPRPHDLAQLGLHPRPLPETPEPGAGCCGRGGRGRPLTLSSPREEACTCLGEVSSEERVFPAGRQPAGPLFPLGMPSPAPACPLPRPSTGWAWLQGLSPALDCSSLAQGAVNHRGCTPLLLGSLALCSASASSPFWSFSQTS